MAKSDTCRGHNGGGRLDQLADRLARYVAGIAVVVVLAALTLPGIAAAAGEAVVASAARLTGDGDRTTLTLELSRPATFRLKKLTGPYRLVVELTDVDFRLPEGSGSEGTGLIKSYRYGAFGAGKPQLVIELTQPVAIARSTMLKASNGAPAQLVLDLTAASRDEFIGKATTSVIEAAAEPAIVPKRRKADPQLVKPVIVIDPGHGGVDNGAKSASGLNEREIVLTFAKEFAQALEAGGRYTVVLSRSTDEFITLKGRVDLAQQLKASLFISLHADWVSPRTAKKAHGLAVYTRSEQASDEEARLLAMRENSADAAAGLQVPQEEDAVQDLLTDLWQEETRVHSRLYAETLIGSVKKSTRLLVQPHRFAAFYVLRNPEVPSVLVELGFLSNAEDAKNLATEGWRKKVTQNMVTSVDTFFSESRKPLSAVQ